jgi:uncharacterized protein involved in exopolysaccharide biosynthesis
MSVAQEFRTIQAQLETRTLELANANTRIAQLEQELTAAQTAEQTSNNLQASQLEQIQGHETAMQALRDEHAQATADLSARVSALETENTEMKEKLKNPAFKAASAGGEDPGTAGGGGEAGSGEGTPHWAAYNALKTGAEKAAYWKENFAAMQAEQRQASK